MKYVFSSLILGSLLSFAGPISSGGPNVQKTVLCEGYKLVSPEPVVLNCKVRLAFIPGNKSQISIFQKIDSNTAFPSEWEFLKKETVAPRPQPGKTLYKLKDGSLTVVESSQTAVLSLAEAQNVQMKCREE